MSHSSLRPHSSRELGSTLVMAILCIAILSLIVIAAFEYTKQVGYQGDRAATFARTEAAAQSFSNVIYGRFCAWVDNHNNLCPGIGDISALDTTTTPSRPAILDPSNPISPPAGSWLSNYKLVVNAYTPKLYPVLPDDSQPSPADYPNYADAYNPATALLYPTKIQKYQTRTPLPYDKTKGTCTYTYKLIVTATLKNPGVGDPGPVTIVRYLQETVVSPFNYARFNNGSLSDGSNNRVYTGPIYSACNLSLTGNPMTVNGQANYVQTFRGKSNNQDDPSNLIFPNQGITLGSTMEAASSAGALRVTPIVQLIPNLSDSLATSPDANGNPSRASTPETGSNNFSVRELIEPPVANVVDPPAIAQNRIYNMADLRIRVSGNNVTITKVDRKNYDSRNDNADIALANNDPLYVAVRNSITLRKPSDPQPFYDSNLSTSTALKTTDINVGAISSYLTSNPSAGVTTIYVWDDTGSGSSSAGNTPVVRLYNGGVLPSGGLSFGSDNGVYIKGDWNTGTRLSGANSFSTGTQVAGSAPPSNTLPSSQSVTLGQNVSSGYTVAPSGVYGDSITQLTQSWDDANSLGTRHGVSTTMNVVFGEGSGADNERLANDIFTDASRASLRFLEDWQGGRRTNTGSEMQIYHSRYYTQFGTTWFNINNKDTLFNPAVTRGLFPKWGSPLFSRGRYYRVSGTPASAL